MPEASEYDDFLRPILGSVSMAAFAEGMASESGVLDFEEAVSRAALKSAHKALATALAEAKTRARRDAFEEAAKAAERVRDNLFPVLSKTRYQDYEVRRYHKLSVGLAVEDIRALATAPAETEKPETGESKTHWALRLAMQYLDRCAAEDQGFHEDGPKPEADACSVCTEIAAVLGIDIESPEYDALVAYPPQPTATNTLEDGHA